MAATSVHIPWYATGFRGDDLEVALQQLAPLALRHGATSFAVYRADQDRYKFLHVMEFPRKDDFERFWYGEEFSDMRAATSSWYQVPLLYSLHDVIAQGALELDPQPLDG